MKRTSRSLKRITRRHFFLNTGFSIGGMALSSLFDTSLLAESTGKSTLPSNPLASKPPHFAPKAKNIIYLFMAGAPSQLDLLDYKPKLKELNGQNIPDELVKGERFAFIKGSPKLL